MSDDLSPYKKFYESPDAGQAPVQTRIFARIADAIIHGLSNHSGAIKKNRERIAELEKSLAEVQHRAQRQAEHIARLSTRYEQLKLLIERAG